MAFILEHCTTFQPQKRYRIRNTHGCHVVDLFLGICPAAHCQKLHIGWFGYTVFGHRYPENGLIQTHKKTFKDWHSFITAGVAEEIPMKRKEDRETRPAIIGESEYTLRIHRDTANVYRKVLRPWTGLKATGKGSLLAAPLPA